MKIVCLEGCSGAGKTTQYHLLSDYYTKTKLKYFAVVEKDYEPFKFIVSEWHKTKGPIVSFTEEDVKKFACARVETFARNFSPLKEELDLLLMDRYFYTSAVYQRNCGLTPEEILQINIDYRAPVPDLTLLFDCDPIICFERANKRNRETGGKHLFSTNPKKISDMRKQYLKLMNRRKEVKIINTDNSVLEIASYLITQINSLFMLPKINQLLK